MYHCVYKREDRLMIRKKDLTKKKKKNRHTYCKCISEIQYILQGQLTVISPMKKQKDRGCGREFSLECCSLCRGFEHYIWFTKQIPSPIIQFKCWSQSQVLLLKQKYNRKQWVMYLYWVLFKCHMWVLKGPTRT